MTSSALQEAIAKAVSDGLRESFERVTELEWSAESVGMHAAAVTEAVLGVLRADDDTRYVAITRGQRQWLTYLQQHCPSILDVCKAYDAYDAVAPNAKDAA